MASDNGQYQKFRKPRPQKRFISSAKNTGTLPLDMILHGDALNVLPTLPDRSVHSVVTSPPYFGLRDYGVHGQIGLEQTPESYVEKLVSVFREVRRVLRPDGVLWLNLGDSYTGSGKGGHSAAKRSQNWQPAYANKGMNYRLGGKQLLGIPWRVAFALQADGWILRSDIIWKKPNPMPESVKDRCTVSHEYVFMLTKSPRYYFDMDSIREPCKEVSLNRVEYGLHHRHPAGGGVGIPPVNTQRMGERFAHPLGRNKRSVWEVSTQSYTGAHFATFPPALIEPMILASCPKDGVVLDPFMGAGTTALVARYHGRHYLGIELNEKYIRLAQDRLRLPFDPRLSQQDVGLSELPLFAGVVE